MEMTSPDTTLGHLAHPARMWPRNLAVLVAVLLLSVLPLAAQGTDDCYMCHQDPDLTGQRDGEEIQVFVDESE